MKTKLNVTIRRDGKNSLVVEIENEAGHACDYWINDDPAEIGEAITDFLRDYGTGV